MPYYKIGAIITRDPVTGAGVSIQPQISTPGEGDTNGKLSQDISLDAFTFYIWCTANPIPGLAVLTRPQIDSNSDIIADANGRDRTAARADMARREREQQAVRDKTEIEPRARR